jgi:N-acetylglutamate synthase-like GNAT family acetyltransferase
MNIRLANKFDTPYIINMLRHFRDASPVEKIKECNNEQYISALYHSIIVGRGVAIVAEYDQPIGMIMGYIDQNVWDPEIRVLKELVYWVEPAYRGTTAGYRLIKAYNDKAKELVEQNRIQLYTMTKMINSPDLDFSRFGYRKTEEVWVAGA